MNNITYYIINNIIYIILLQTFKNPINIHLYNLLYYYLFSY